MLFLVLTTLSVLVPPGAQAVSRDAVEHLKPVEHLEPVEHLGSVEHLRSAEHLKPVEHPRVRRKVSGDCCMGVCQGTCNAMGKCDCH